MSHKNGSKLSHTKKNKIVTKTKKIQIVEHPRTQNITAYHTWSFFFWQVEVGLTDSQANLADEFTVSVKQRSVEQQYKDLLDLGKDRKDKLEESRKAFSLVREAGELGNWIVEKVSVVKLRNGCVAISIVLIHIFGSAAGQGYCRGASCQTINFAMSWSCLWEFQNFTRLWLLVYCKFVIFAVFSHVGLCKLHL